MRQCIYVKAGISTKLTNINLAFIMIFFNFMLAASLPSHSLRSNKDNSLSVPRVKTNTDARAFTLVPRLFGTTFHYLSIQLFQLLPSRNLWRHSSLTWPFPYRHRHARWPFVMELFLLFCDWTLIRLSHHWPWLHREYWCYRNLIDWLIFLYDHQHVCFHYIFDLTLYLVTYYWM